MPIDCVSSFVDATEACNGRVLICLKDKDTGKGYFKGFDINGGVPTGSIYASTGFQSSSNSPPYTQDYEVTDVAGFQCFFVPYNTGAHSTDRFVIQSTDGSEAEACELSFNVPTTAQCGNTEAVYTCTNPQIQAAAGEDLCISKSDLGIPDGPGITCIVANIRFSPGVTFIVSDPDCVTKVPAGEVTASNSPLVMTFDVFCNNVTQAVDCQATVVIEHDKGNPPEPFPEPVISECQNGQVSLLRGVAKTLNVVGCECCGTDRITWSSPDPQLSFNPAKGASTQVTASATGSFTIEVECCADQESH